MKNIFLIIFVLLMNISTGFSQIAMCKNITVYTDINGADTIVALDIDNGSTALACGIDSVYLSKYIFDCSDLGINTVKLYVRDLCSNIDSCTATVTFVDTIPPIPNCINRTVILNLAGVGSIPTVQVNGFSTDNCGVDTVYLSKNNFNCSEVGNNIITMYVVDSSGNIDSCNATINVLDWFGPVAKCKDTTIYLDVSGNFIIDSSYINNVSTDNCVISTITLSQYNYNCSSIGVPTSVTMTVKDIGGNTNACNANITVLDTIKPIANCKNSIAYLNSLGSITIDSSYINNGSTDNCTIKTIKLDNYTFDCSNIGIVNTIKMIVTDGSGNKDSCTANITVLDTFPPVMICKNDSVYINLAGNAIIDTTYINNGIYDVCNLDTMFLDKYVFNCTNVGNNLVTIYAKDKSGNIDSCSSTILVLDSIKPIAICKDTVIYLNSIGSFTIDSSFINNVSTDNCAISTITLSQYNFNCSNVSVVNIVTLTVIDVGGNTNTCNANVTVLDTNKPSAICKTSTIYLNSSGIFVIDSSFVNNGSTDDCGIKTIKLDNYTFDCSDIGVVNSVKMIVTDNSGNKDSCNGGVTVLDSIPPVVVCKDTVVYLDVNGGIKIDTSFVYISSFDICGVDTVILSLDTFDCNNLGLTQIQVIAVDIYGNKDSCVSNVIVKDTVPPVAFCNNRTIIINSQGYVVLPAFLINNGSTDNCAVDTVLLSKDTFDCSDIGLNIVTLYVYDINGNVDSCTGNVNVIDIIPPVILCKDTTVYLNALGIAILDTSFVISSVSDNCQLDSVYLEKNSFLCIDSGIQIVKVYAVDIYGNIDSCSVAITVVDSIKPVANCKNDSVYLNAFGSGSININDINNGSSDICGIRTLTLSKYFYGCINVGINSVKMVVTDFGNNTDTCTAIVTVFDTIKPVAICKNAILYLNSSGGFTIDSSFVNNGSTDICGINTITLSQYNFNCSDTGVNSVTMYVTDNSGNVDSCIANITIYDTIPPIINCKNDTAYLNLLGGVTIDTSFVYTSFSDNCGIDTMYLDKYNFSCSDTGINSVNVYLKDNSGNMDSCTVIITVLDTIKPVANCQNVTAYLNAIGTVSVGSNLIDNGSYDSCGIKTISLSKYIYNCTNVGVNIVTLTALDFNGNFDTCSSVVTIIDSIKPIANCKDTTIYLNNTGSFIIDSSFINNVSTDNCGIATIKLSKYNFNCIDSGLNIITLYVTDVNSNVDSCNANITVKDTTPPVVTCKDTTIYLNSVGVFTIDTSFIYTSFFDNCEIDTMYLSKYSYNCTNIGTSIISIFIKDKSGNRDTCTANITVLDTIKPVAICQNVTYYLNNAGTIVVFPNVINNGSTDNCGVSSINLFPNNFDCTKVGVNTVKLTVYDNSLNSDTCFATVTIIDTFPPIVTCKDTLIYLNASGNFTIDTSFINNTITDNCIIDSVYLDKYSFSCTDSGVNSVTIYATDVNGNIDSCSATVTVLDTVPPDVTCKDTTIYLNAIGVFTIDTSFIYTSFSDNCEVDTMYLSKYNYNCLDTGTSSITIFIEDIHGNIDSCKANVKVLDTISPVVNCKDTVIYLDNTGNYGIDSSFVNNGSTDNCGISYMNVIQNKFNCTNIGVNQVTLIVTDNSGNEDSCTANITVVDTMPPVIVCKDTSVYLNLAGNFTIDTSFVLSSFSDNCEVDSVYLSNDSFNCVNYGVNSVTIYVTDIYGNIDSCVSTVTVIDTVKPIISCKDTTVYLSSLGEVFIDTSFVLTGFSDNCGIDSIWLSKDSFYCVDFGVTQVFIIVKDIHGNIDSCASNVNVLDTIPPIINCTDTVVYLNNSGTFTIDSSFVVGYVSENCLIDSILFSVKTFDCSDIGVNQINVSARDIWGNVDSCKSLITVIDTIKPIANCQSITIYLNNTGNYVIDTSYINVFSTDNCGIDTMYLSKYSFNCIDVPLSATTLYVVDKSGNIDSCTALVAVIDTNSLVLNCTDTTIYLDGTGNFTIDSSYIDQGGSAVCGVASMKLSNYVYNCADVGVNPIKMVVTSYSGSKDSCTANVTVLDTLPPIANCRNATIYLNAAGTFNIGTVYVNNGSTDNCGISFMTLSKYFYDCDDIGANTVTLTVIDLYGNSDTCQAIVTVLDTINPNPICKDTIIYLNNTGSYTIDSTYINNGSKDNCAIATITLSKYNYNCVDSGINSITMYVTDVNGNLDSCTANITVLDTINPIPNCKDTTIYLDNSGNYTIDSSYINNLSSDNCTISTITLSKTNYNCLDTGINSITMYVTDINGNLDSCTARVMVKDTIRPNPICKDTIIYLNSSGNYTMDSSYINNGSNDNCAIATITLSKTIYNCLDTGINSITMYVTDVNGNIDSCVANVTVKDTIRPNPICKDTIIYLNNTGNYAIDSSYINNGSNDNCAIATITLSKINYNCSNIGVNSVTMYVTDVSGNIDSCTANVTVMDTIDPIPNCKDTIIYLNPGGNYTIDSSYVNNLSTDNCAIATITLSKYSFNCAEVGNNTITMYVTDVNGNVDSCTANVLVNDTLLPIPVCKDTILFLNTIGSYTIDSSYINNGSNDNCGIATITLSKYTFDCTDTGTNTVTMYVTDVNGNIDSCISLVTFKDTIPPVILCKDTLVYLSATGVFTIDTSFVTRNITDNCEVDTVYLDRYNFTCADTGLQTVVLYAEDLKGNIDSCIVTVTVKDSVIPIPVCRDTTIYLNAGGTITIDSSWIDINSSDICGIKTIKLNKYTFNCTNVGLNVVKMIVTDFHGNSDSCVANVIVLDTLIPNPICTDTTVYLNQFGLIVIDSSFVNNLSHDNCGIARIEIDVDSFSCINIGINPVTVTVTDVNGNIDSCIANVTISDSIMPYSFAGNDTTVCVSYNFQLKGNLPPSHQFGSWSLFGSPSATFFTTINNPTVSNLSVGTYHFVWSVTNGNGCNVSRDTVDIIVLDTVYSYAGKDSSICNNYLYTLQGNVLAVGVYGEWKVITSPNTPVFSDSSSSVSTISGLIEGTYVLVWEVTNNYCDIKYDTVKITVSDLPIASANIDQDLCATYSTNFAGNPLIGTTTGLWTFHTSTNASIPVISNATLPNATASSLLEGTYSFIWTVSNGICPPNKDTVLINVYNMPVSITGADTTLCGVDSMNLRANFPAGLSSGTWTYNNVSSPSAPIFGNINAFNTKISGLQTGIYTFYWTVINGNCTPAIDTVEITVFNPVAINAGPDSSYCNQYQVTLTANQLGGFSTGRWYVDSSASPPNYPTIVSPTSPITNITGLIEGTYKFVWKVVTGKCYTVYDTVIIKIFDQHISIVSSDQFLCGATSAQITGNTVTGTASTIWKVASVTPNTPTFNPNLPTTTISGLQQGGIYSMYWEITNGVCPVSRDTVNVVILYVPVASFTQDTMEICENDCVQFTNTSTVLGINTITNYLWEINNATYNGNPQTVCFSDTGIYDMNLIVTASNGCKDTLLSNGSVIVHQNPVAGFSYTVPNLAFGSKNLAIKDKSTNASTYLYSFGDGNTSTLPNPKYIYSDSGYFNVKQLVISSFGCRDSTVQVIYLNNLLVFAPNSFTPNKDGKNDVFLPILYGDDASEYELLIFNRWGELIFESHDKTKGWDGTYSGELAPTGTYVYRLTTVYIKGNAVKLYKGHVNLLR